MVRPWLEVTDAAYGATLQQPKFTFSPADTTCEQKRIPTGDMCQVDPQQFKKFMEDKCVGRQSCAVTAADAVDVFGSGGAWEIVVATSSTTYSTLVSRFKRSPVTWRARAECSSFLSRHAPLVMP